MPGNLSCANVTVTFTFRTILHRIIEIVKVVTRYVVWKNFLLFCEMQIYDIRGFGTFSNKERNSCLDSTSTSLKELSSYAGLAVKVKGRNSFGV
jgi:hypothetical protein